MRSASFAAALLAITALPIASCATIGVDAATSALDRAEAAYGRIRRLAEIALPFLPPDHARRVRLALGLADRALAAARAASTIAEQLEQLRALERETAAIATASGAD